MLKVCCSVSLLEEKLKFVVYPSVGSVRLQYKITFYVFRFTVLLWQVLYKTLDFLKTCAVFGAMCIT